MESPTRQPPSRKQPWSGRGDTSPVVRNNLGEGKMSELLRRFLNDDSGATAIEYGLIAAGISVAIIAVVNTLGTNLNTPHSAAFPVS